MCWESLNLGCVTRRQRENRYVCVCVSVRVCVCAVRVWDELPSNIWINHLLRRNPKATIRSIVNMWPWSGLIAMNGYIQGEYENVFWLGQKTQNTHTLVHYQWIVKFLVTSVHCRLLFVSCKLLRCLGLPCVYSFIKKLWLFILWLNTFVWLFVFGTFETVTQTLHLTYDWLIVYLGHRKPHNAW